MIELEESINLAQVDQITAERMRKSSRLLKDSKSLHKIEMRHVETGKLSKLGQRWSKNFDWQYRKYTELLKLMRIDIKEEKQPEVAKSLDHSDHNQEHFIRHFKGQWKPALESEMLITHCKKHSQLSKYPTQSSYEEFRYKTKHECIKLHKERMAELNLFKSQMRKSDNRAAGKKSRPSLIKHILKIQELPMRLEENTPKLSEYIKENITLQPIKKAHEKLKTLTPEKAKQSGFLEKKSTPLKLDNKRSHIKQHSESLNLKKSEVSAWTFHNIEQQN